MEKEKEKETRAGVSLVSYRPFFRELDVEVLSVLQCGLLSCTTLDSEMNTKVRSKSMYLFVHPSFGLAMHLSVSACLSVYVSVHVFIGPSVCVSVLVLSIFSAE